MAPSDPAYTAVPNPGPSSPSAPDFPSPDPNNFSHNPRDSSIMSPPTPDPDTANLLGRPGSEYLPAPSIMTRDSTYSSLPGTPPLRGDERKSWGSGVGLAAAAEGISGAESRRPGNARAPSNLAHSSLGWNNTNNDRLSVSDEDEEQGHITPAVAGIGAAEVQTEKPRWAEVVDSSPKKKRSKKLLLAGACVGLLALIALAVGLGVGLTRKSTKDGSSSSSEDGQAGNEGDSKSHSGTGTATASSTATPSATPTSGTRGSLVTLDDGTTMTYDNPFGGEWHWDEANPFNSSARANSWSPRLNEPWDFAKNRIYGVNLGGWLNTEPFIVPALYEKYHEVNGQTAIDEYTLSQNMGSNLTAAMTEHYETFITEKDFIEIASAGLNWVRLPMAFWAIETWDDEPFLERVSWTYVLKALKWARKYGIRVNLDLHTVPGSQNGWNHSGRQGTPNWLNGPMGLAHAQRSLDYIRTLAQFISQPEYSDVVQMFGFINEPNGNALSKGPIASFYVEAHNIIRDITGIGKGPQLSAHDAFLGITNWYDFAPGADRIMLDQHNYMVFQDQPTGDLDDLKVKPCEWWAKSTNTTYQTYGPVNTGEWSAAWNDCGLWVNNVLSGYRYDGTFDGYAGKATGSCDYWNDYTQWNQSTIDALNHFVRGSMDAFQDYFFWTWKIGNSTGSIPQPNPFWNYQLGLEHGWIPKDPRTAIGTCEGDGIASNPFSSFSNPAVTGGAGAGMISGAQSSSYPWPPVSLTNIAASEMDAIYQYTQTADPITMPAPTFTSPGSSATIDAGNGWANPSADNRKAYASFSDCSYPPLYSAATIGVPANACGAGLTQPTKRSEPIPEIKRAAYPQPTTPPSRR